MTNARDTVLIQTKLKLAEKYARKVMVAGSEPKRKKFRQMARHYRRQAEELARRTAGP